MAMYGGNYYGPLEVSASLNEQAPRQREIPMQPTFSPTPLNHKSPPPMYHPGHMSAQGVTTPQVMEGGVLDYKDILDERFASPRVIIKQS